MKNVETTTIIDASPAEIWAVLMDFPRYSAWNPFITQIAGDAQVGQKLKAVIQAPRQKPMSFRPRVLHHQPQQEFRWLGHLGIPGLFDGEHYFRLEAIGPKQTKFIHGEQFSGLLAPLILKRIGKATLAGFEAMNMAIKQVVEKN